MADRIGQQLGNYRLVRLLGKGGFAEVYLGEHERDRTLVAVKVLHTRLSSPDDLKAFIKEARSFRLTHPNIVRLLDFDIGADDSPFLIMEYAPNGTLRQRYPRGSRLPLVTVVTYVKQVAAALQYAHDRGLIHRDVKPENMLLGQHDEVLLSDFGIATIAHSTSSMSVQMATGTVPYMAPEQIQAHPRPASDQYSLGIVVYEWLSGDRPFHGSFTELCAQHMFASPPSLQQKIATISPDVEQVVRTALEKDPHQRFASVQAFANALEQACQVSPGEAVPSSQLPPSSEALTSLRETQQPTKLATSISQSSLPTELSTPSSYTALRADVLTVPSDSQQATELVAPPSQASMPKNVISEDAPTEVATRSPERSGGGERVPEIVEERSPEEEGLREAREEQARRNMEEELRKAQEEQARRAEKERLRKAGEEKAREERAWKAEEERVHKAKETVSTPTQMATSSLQTLLPSDAIVAVKPSKPSDSRRFVLLGLAGLVILALASGIVWFTVHHAASAWSITEFPLPTSGEASGITAGHDGNLWFTESGDNKIGRISPGGTVTEFPLRPSQSAPYGITAGPDGNLWFTEFDGNKIGRISPSGTVTEFPLPTSSSPFGITAGPDGNLWFTVPLSSRIGRISPSGTVTEFPIPTPQDSPSGITAGPDGNLWFTVGNDSKIGRISPSGTVTEFPLPTSGSSSAGITAGPDGNLWFTVRNDSKIGRISPSGTVTEFPLPTSGEASGITAGPDNNLWFTEPNGNKIGRISPSGTVTEFPIPTPQSAPYGITAGPDNNLWFTESGGNKIGRITSGK